MSSTLISSDMGIPISLSDLRDYSIEVRVRNARILGLMRRAGISTMSELSRKCGVSPQEIGRLVNLKITPLHRSGQYSKMVERIADALFCHPDDMFTDRQRTQFMVSNRRCVEVAEAEVEAHLAALEVVAPDEHVALLERDDAIQKALARITPRERLIVEARFGLNDGQEKTYRQIGDVIGTGPERVRQIEARALTKLGAAAAGLLGVKAQATFDPQAFIEHQAGLIALARAQQRRHEQEHR